jgi:hypothetical protein
MEKILISKPALTHIGRQGDAKMGYKSRSAGEQALADRQHTIQICRELLASPKTNEEDRKLYQRILYRAVGDPFAPHPPDHPLIAEFKKRWRYLN